MSMRVWEKVQKMPPALNFAGRSGHTVGSGPLFPVCKRFAFLVGWISEGFRGSDSGVGLLAQSVDIGAGGILESAFWGVTSGAAPEAEVPDKCR